MNPSSISFLLTRPSRDVTALLDVFDLRFDISTHTSLAGRDCTGVIFVPIFNISTHTSLAGRDQPGFRD